MILVKVHEQEPPLAHRIETFPVTIGRSIRCGIHVDDPSVSACHAELCRNGDEYVLKDLDSTNGIARGGTKVQELTLSANETVYLGDVRIELIIEEHLADTRQNVLPPEDDEPSRTSAWKVVLSLTLGFSLLAAGPVVDQFSVEWPPERYIEILGTALAYWGVLVGVAFLLSLFCKLNSKRFHFHRVLNTLVLAVFGAKALAVLTPSVAFNLRSAPLAVWILPVGYAGLVTLSSFKLQRWAFRRWQSRRRAAVAAGFGLATLAVAHAALARRGGPGDRDRMPALGYPLRNVQAVRQTPDDLIFDMALSIAETDEARIHILERLEAAKDAGE